MPEKITKPRDVQIAHYLTGLNLTGNAYETHRDALSQACAQYDSIAEMVAELLAADDSDERDETRREEARRTIEEDALSVQVRSGWYSPGQADADTKPAEFEILLCTGGPAVRILGDLSEHGEPEKARLQYQGWFIPWQDVPWHILPHKADAEETLLAYARCFWFSE